MDRLEPIRETERIQIKSFKHDGKIHRLWEQNWLVPSHALDQRLQELDVWVLINDRTPIREADGNYWISKVPSVVYFLPGKWFNIVGLIEDGTVRFYCNVASPPYKYDDVITYIDYDLDVIRYPNGRIDVVDRDEYKSHREKYKYSGQTVHKIENGLSSLVGMIERNHFLFDQELVKQIYTTWKREREGSR